ncbi:hypothetical protein HOD29_05120 [archaeon]|nr:hypothetical protein [archaeon]
MKKQVFLIPEFRNNAIYVKSVNFIYRSRKPLFRLSEFGEVVKKHEDGLPVYLHNMHTGSDSKKLLRFKEGSMYTVEANIHPHYQGKCAFLEVVDIQNQENPKEFEVETEFIFSKNSPLFKIDRNGKPIPKKSKKGLAVFCHSNHHGGMVSRRKYSVMGTVKVKPGTSVGMLFPVSII